MRKTLVILQTTIAAVLVFGTVTRALAQTAPLQSRTAQTASSNEQTPPMAASRPKPRFELSAMYSAAPTLSRDEVDPKAIVAGPEPAPLGQKPAPTQQAHLTLPAVPGLDGAKPQPEPAAPDNNYLSEYNVDWSGWIGAHADRWYYTLKATEEMLGLRFATVRPAMIKYTCYADGSIGNLVLKQSSGVPAYDRLQLETLMATMPTMPFPHGTHRSSITLCQGWESHPRQPGENDFLPGTFGRDFPKERVSQWSAGR